MPTREPGFPEQFRNFAHSRQPIVIAASLAVILALAGLSRHTGVDLLIPLGLGLTLVLGYLVGAVTVAEGVATLVGGDVTGYRRALGWGAAWMALGALLAALLASALVVTLTSGFIGNGAHLTEVFVLAILIGTILWMTVARQLGLPVSATHTLAGALVIVGLAAYGPHAVRWGSVVTKVALPLAITPFLAILGALVLSWVIPALVAGHSTETLARAHWVSSAAASVARGLNEGPKVVAMCAVLLPVTGHGAGTAAPFWLFALTAVTVGAGSYMAGERVTKTLAEKVTEMRHDDALAANLVTALLMGVASNLGLPVSNAQVGSGAITGVGLRKGTEGVNWGMVRAMALAWAITIPIAGLLALGAYLLLRLVHG